MQMSDEKFEELLSMDIRGLLEGRNRSKEREITRAPESLERRLRILKTMKRNVENQMSSQRSRIANKRHELNLMGDDGSLWVEFKAEEEEWRVRALKFLQILEVNISRTKAACKEVRMAQHEKRDIVDELITELYVKPKENSKSRERGA